MKAFISVLFGAAWITAPAFAQSALEDSLSGALRGCQEWVLNPASWVDGPEPFLFVVDLGDRIGLVEAVSEASLPPEELRLANHFWQINSTPDAGYVLVLSDRLPMCHITGGGAVDLQPAAERVLASPEFQKRWEKTEEEIKGEMISSHYRHREHSGFILVASRARTPGQRTDRVQFIATAMIERSN